MNILFDGDSIFPAVALLASINKLSEHKTMTVFLIAHFIINLTSSILAWNYINSIICYQINILVSVIIVCFYLNKKALPLAAIILGIIFFEDRSAPNSLSWCIGAVIICVLCFQYFYNRLRYPSIIRTSEDSKSWFVNGIFLFYFGSFMFFSVFRYATINHWDIIGLWELNNWVYGAMCLLFVIAYRLKQWNSLLQSLF